MRRRMTASDSFTGFAPVRGRFQENDCVCSRRVARIAQKQQRRQVIKRLTLSESTSTIFCVFVCAVVLRPRLQVNLDRDFESFSLVWRRHTDATPIWIKYGERMDSVLPRIWPGCRSDQRAGSFGWSTAGSCFPVLRAKSLTPLYELILWSS